jgi:hypothetical protein
MGDSAHTTHHTNPEKNQRSPPFLEDTNIFQKSARVVLVFRTEFWIVPREPIFEKCSHLREKGGGVDAFENDPPFRSKPTVHVVQTGIAVVDVGTVKFSFAFEL